MSGFVKLEHGKVKIEHWSTSSSIKVIVNGEQPTESGGTEPLVSELWLSYEEFEHLFKAMNLLVNDDGTKEFPL